jgi:hypothetical protein
MNVDRLSVTMDAALGEAARKAARRARVSLSAWIAEAAADRLRHEALNEALVEWQVADGAFTADELAAASKALTPSPLARPRKTRAKKTGSTGSKR